jgi:hypothetical protein
MRQSGWQSPSAWNGAAELFLGACLLIRDIFVDALPGGLFFAIGLASRRLNLAQINVFLAPYHPPTWALGLLLIAACYLAGRLLSAIMGLRVEFWKFVHWSDPDWLAEYPTEVTSRDLVIRHYFPDLSREMDRRESRARLLFSSIAALLLGWLVFFVLHPAFADIIIWTAGLVFLATLTAMSYLGRVRKAVHQAGREIQEIDNAAREASAVIQPTGEELRFIIDSIFKAAKLSSSRRLSLEPEGPEAEPEALASTPPEPNHARGEAFAASSSGSSFGTPRL